MAKLIDLTGQRFGRLTVVERAENTSQGKARWTCVCDCGNLSTVPGKCLRRGETRSCGCLAKEEGGNRKHDKRYTRLYNIWHGMKQRCNNPNNQFYDRYGGRGITVCEEWTHDFQKFWKWAMTNGYRDDLSIDRIDNDKGYSPDNCRWASQKEQQNNVAKNRKLTIAGETRTLKQWCDAFQLSTDLVKNRLRRGWTPEEALGLVPRKK